MTKQIFALEMIVGKDEYKWAEPAIVSLDKLTLEYLAGMDIKTPDFDSMQIESLFSDIATHLDNCLAYRREIYTLQATAAKAAMDFVLYEQQSSALKTIELAEALLQQRQEERNRTTFAVQAFDTDSSAPLGKGFKALAATSLSVADISVVAEEKRIEAVKQKWAVLDEYQAALKDRHSEQGNALHYVERFERVQAFFAEEIHDAYEKARAAHAGAEAIFKLGKDYEVPPLKGKFLDELVKWNRKIARELNKRKRDDVDFEYVIPLVSKIGDKEIVSAAYYAEAMGDGKTKELIFDLRNSVFPDSLKTLRLRGVGLTFGVADATKPEAIDPHRYERLTAIISIPAVTDPFSTQNAEVARRPVILGNVTISDPSYPVSFAQGPNINNVDPRGEWRIRVASQVRTLSTGTTPRTVAISDLKLHLLLTAQPDKRLADWPASF